MQASAGHPKGATGPVDSKRVLMVVFFTIFLDMVGFGLVLPLIPLYVKNLGGDAQSAGLLFTSFAATQLVATPWLGRLADRYGRRPVILFSLVGNAFAMGLFASATSLYLLFFSRLLAGATAGNLSACQAAIADCTRREERAKGMGLVGAGMGLGMVLGPVIGGLLSHYGTWAPPAAASAMALIDLAMAYFFMPETRWSQVDMAPAPAPAPAPDAGAAPAKTRSTFLTALAEPRFARIMALYFLSFLCLTNMQVALALLTKERFGWTEKEVSYLFALFGATGLVIQGGLIGRLVKKVGEVNLLVIAGLFSATGLGLISVAYSVPYLMLGAALFSCGFAMSTPTLSSLASRCARPEQQGVIMGMSQSSGGLARTVGPTWAGFLFQKVGAGAPFAGGAIYATLWVLVALTLRRLMRPTPQEDQGVVQEVPS